LILVISSFNLAFPGAFNIDLFESKIPFAARVNLAGAAGVAFAAAGAGAGSAIGAALAGVEAGTGAGVIGLLAMAPSQPTAAVAGVQLASLQHSPEALFQTSPDALLQLWTSCAKAKPEMLVPSTSAEMR